MSARLSPDGMYYWDGQSWKSTLSPDGRMRWDGAAWRPVSYAVATPYGLAARPQREPTSWTKPLQYAVAGWYVWSIAYTLSEPFWLGGTMNGFLNLSLQRQQQLNPEVSPPPAAFTDMMSNLVSASLWISAIFYAAIFAVIIVGAWRRWVWMFYVVLVLLGVTCLLVPIDLLYAVMGTMIGAASGLAMPSWVYPVASLTGLPAVALFVWMLIALRRRGPWAMRRPELS